MKQLLWSVVTACLLVNVQADVLIEQKLEGLAEGTVVMKIKEDRGRMDMSIAALQNVSMIFDWKKDLCIFLRHEQKGFSTFSLSDLKSKAPQNKVDPKLYKPAVATGTKEEVSGFNTEIFEMNVEGTGKIRMWIDAKFPNFKEVNAQVNRMTEALSNEPSMDPEQFGINGMPLKTEVETKDGKIITTITKFSDAEITPDNFEVPADYQNLKK